MQGEQRDQEIVVGQEPNVPGSASFEIAKVLSVLVGVAARNHPTPNRVDLVDAEPEPIKHTGPIVVGGIELVLHLVEWNLECV